MAFRFQNRGNEKGNYGQLPGKGRFGDFLSNVQIATSRHYHQVVVSASETRVPPRYCKCKDTDFSACHSMAFTAKAPEKFNLKIVYLCCWIIYSLIAILLFAHH